MIKPGLCSITFRKLPAAEVVELVVRAGLDGIEWGGDVHVPHGDLAAAREVRALTADAGLCAPSYGSYYRVVQSEHDRLPFARVLETALALGASNIRVWAGAHGSAEATDDYRREVAAETRRIAILAAAEGVAVSYEFHGGTLTDTNESTLALFDAVDCDNLYAFWQPAVGQAVESRLDGLNRLLPRLTHLHVFQWKGSHPGLEKLPLAEGADEWRQYLPVAAATGREHFAFLEFVRDDAPEQFLADAATLRQWLAELSVYE